MKNFTFRALLGFVARALLVTPFALLMVNMGEYAEINSNLSVFIAIVLTIATLLYMAVMIFVPAEYAIKTNVTVIEFHMTALQTWAVLGSAVLILGLSVGLAVVTASYFFATVLLLYAVSLYMWPKYIKKVDDASKEFMMQSLRT